MKVSRKQQISKWFEYPNSDGASFLFKQIPQYKRQSMIQGAVAFKAEDSDSLTFGDFIVNLIKESLIDWNKVEDSETGKPLEVNSENKYLLLNHEDFYLFAQKCVKELDEEAAKQQEAQQKN